MGLGHPKKEEDVKEGEKGLRELRGSSLCKRGKGAAAQGEEGKRVQKKKGKLEGGRFLDAAPPAGRKEGGRDRLPKRKREIHVEIFGFLDQRKRNPAGERGATIGRPNLGGVGGPFRMGKKEMKIRKRYFLIPGTDRGPGHPKVRGKKIEA